MKTRTLFSQFSTRIGLTMALLLLLFSASTLRAQETGSIKGKVTESSTGEILEFATVFLSQNGVIKGGANTDANGEYLISSVQPGAYTLVAKYAGNSSSPINVTVTAGKQTFANLQIDEGRALELSEVIVTESKRDRKDYDAIQLDQSPRGKPVKRSANRPEVQYNTNEYQPLPPLDREGYDHIAESGFLEALKTPQSTFSIDVDAASYSNCRRMLLRENRLPPAGAVRIEEFINYFDYEYPQPQGEHPFSITAEAGECPWAKDHQLVMIGLQGKIIEDKELPSANLVFLVDVSGSMDEPNKLPLVQQSLNLLTDHLRPQDHVAIVVYAGAAGLVLPPTSGKDKTTIKDAIDRLKAGGSTAGGAGIQLAYKTATDNFKKNGNNRVILCTDGDFNVGMSSDDEMVRLIEKERESGIFLSVLGFGTGNYQDAKMEKLADNGNGNYAYIDQLLEAKKVLVKEMGGTLATIAKDVKIQVEFNPAKVKSYRLIGYENRALENEDFDNDKKDAGELGAGHTVTALYEIIPSKSLSNELENNNLRYQTAKLNENAASDELLSVKFRYKAPKDTVSKLIEQPLRQGDLNKAETSENFRFSAAVAAFGMLLRDSKFKGDATYAMAKTMAKGAIGKDEEGYRAEFLKMIEITDLLGAQAKGK